jgi:hypothetical protein
MENGGNGAGPVATWPGSPIAVPPRRGAQWYSEAMAMFRQAPLPWMALGAATVVLQIALQALPGFGSVLDKVLMPVVGAGLLVAARAAARRERPALRHLLSAFLAPAGAQMAIIAAGLIAFGVEALVVHWLADANLLALDDQSRSRIDGTTLLAAFAAGILVSLPLAFVPQLVLFGGRTAGAAFVESFLAFRLNVLPLLAYGAIGMALLAVGVATLGIALIVVFPLWATATWAAWRDIFR